MKPPRHQTRHRRNSCLHTSTPEPEFGDWRVHVPNAEEVEHIVPNLDGFRNVLHRTRVVAQALQETDPDEVVPIKGWPRFIRLSIAVFILLPFSLVLVFALVQQLQSAVPSLGRIGFWTSVPVWYATMGALLFAVLIITRLLYEGLIFIYVLGHELTHAIAAKICGGKVSSFKVNLDGGYVETDVTNSFIALSPYFIPLWMLGWMLLLWLVNLAFPFEEYQEWFYAGFGFWWFFHLYWTMWVIPREQPDMLENGLLFSLLLVIGVNLLLLVGVLWIFDVITIGGFCQDFILCARRLYAAAAELFSALMN